jgi:hypothetical protein
VAQDVGGDGDVVWPEDTREDTSKGRGMGGGMGGMPVPPLPFVLIGHAASFTPY